MQIARVVIASAAAVVGLLVLFPVILLGIPFRVVAWLTQGIARMIEPPIRSWQTLVEFHPRLGWKTLPALDTFCHAEPSGEIFHLTTDSDGWRGKGSIVESDIVVFGDSFAFGYGVDDDQSFTELVPGVRVKAVGAPGYSMVQSLLLMRELGAALKGKLIVWLVYVGNDIYDNLKPSMTGYPSPFVHTDNGSGAWMIETAHLIPRKVPHNPDIHLRQHHEMLGNTYSATYVAERAYSAAEYLIREGDRACREAGATLVVITLPDLFELTHAGLGRLRDYSPASDTFDPEMPHQRIQTICTVLDVPFKSAKAVLSSEDYNPGDRHLTPEGNRKLAQLISRVHRQHVDAERSSEPEKKISLEPPRSAVAASAMKAAG